MVAWRGTATQFTGRRSGAASADLVVGLDFGTSCTKVVVRSPFIAGARAVAVRWRDVRRANAYLLPYALRSELLLERLGSFPLNPGRQCWKRRSVRVAT